MNLATRCWLFHERTEMNSDLPIILSLLQILLLILTVVLRYSFTTTVGVKKLLVSINFVCVCVIMNVYL